MNKRCGIWQILLLTGWLALAGCTNSTSTPMPDRTPQVSCTPLNSGSDEVVVHITIKNNSDTAIYLFDSTRMPYVLEQENDLVILYGVNPPDPNTEYIMIEIPPTKILPPGEQFEEDVSLTPLRLGNHYSLPRERNSAVTKHGTTTVYCEVGWGYTPILSHSEEQEVHSINQLIEWQQLSRTEPIQVQFP